MFILKIVANDLRKASSVERDRAAVAELVLADRGAQLREEQAMVSEFQDTAPGMQARVDEFVEQYAESTKCVIDRECSDVKKHERDLVENAEALTMSSGPHSQTSAPAHESRSANMSNEVCYKSCSLHKSIYSALQRDDGVCFDSHSGSPADPALCNLNCPGNSSQFCGGDSWYTFHLMYLWVAPVEAICFGMPEPFGNNMPKSTTVRLDYFNEIVPCISTCPNGQHLASHKPVCDLLLRKWVVRQRGFEIKCASVSHVAHAEVHFLCQEGTENNGCDIKCIDGYAIASNTLKCKVVDFKTALRTLTGNVSCIPQSCGVTSIACEQFTHFCGTTFSGLCHLHLQICVFSKRIALRQERVPLEVQI